MRDLFDIAVIGGGAAGCAAAEEAARLGAKVVLIERNRLLGGSAWLRERLPTRMLHEVVAQLSGQATPSPNEHITSVELSKLLPGLDSQREAHSEQLSKSLDQHHVLRLHARAQLAPGGQVDLTSIRGEHHRITARHIILATGSRAVSAPGARIDHELILDLGSALSAVYLPRTLAVVGRGAAAVEVAGLFAALGTQTHLIVEGNTVLDDFDPCLQDAFVSSFKSIGGTMLWNHTVVQAGEDGDGGARCTVREQRTGASLTLDVDRVIMATHREATGNSLGLDHVNVQKTSMGLLKVSDRFETTAPGIYAVGAAIGGCTSPEQATAQACQAVRNAMNHTDGSRTDTTPQASCSEVILTSPELARLGQAEQAVPGARVATVFDGPVGLKLVANADQRVVGLHSWGPGAKARLAALHGVVADRWTLQQLNSSPVDAPAFEHGRAAANTLLTRSLSVEDLMLDPDDLLAGVIPTPTGTSAA